MNTWKKRKIKVNAAYLIFDEQIGSDIVRRQVIPVLERLRNKLGVNKFYLINFLPWHWFLRNNDESKKIGRDLEKNGIAYVRIPTPFAFPNFTLENGWKMNLTYNRITASLVLLFALPILFVYVKLFGVRLFHSRSYVSALPVLVIKLLSKDIGFIFDPRSDFPEENALRERWSYDHPDYRFWKYIEKKYCKYADAVIAVGEQFALHCRRIHANSKLVTICNNVDTRSFLLDDGSRRQYRKYYSLEGKTVFCYSGSLYKSHWNNPETYVKFILALKRNLPDLKCAFIFLTPADCGRILKSALSTYGVDKDSYVIINPQFHEIPAYLSAADIGMYFLDFYSPRLGTKVVEYCAIGLPLVVNKNAGGATHLVNELGLGVSLSNESILAVDCHWDAQSRSVMLGLIRNKADFGSRCREFAVSECDEAVVVGRYLRLYEKMGVSIAERSKRVIPGGQQGRKHT